MNMQEADLFVSKDKSGLNDVMTMNNYEAQTCGNCGREINCCGDLNCECADLNIPEQVQNFIGASFDGCLCRTCILKLVHEMESTKLNK